MSLFNVEQFNKDFKDRPDKAILGLIRFIESSNPPVDLPLEIFTVPSPHKLFRIDLKLIARLDRVVGQKLKDPRILFFVEAVHQCQRQYNYLEEFLKDIDFETLLVYCGYYYEWCRFREGITMHDNPNTIEVINSVLNRKLLLAHENDLKIIGSESQKEFDNFSYGLLHKIFSNEILEKRIIKVFNKIDLANHLSFLMEWVLQLDLKILLEKKGCYRFEANDESMLLDWKIANLKYQACGHFYLNLSGMVQNEDEEYILNSNIDDYSKEARIRMLANQLEFCKERFPERIQFKDGTGFDSLHFFNFINHLSQDANSLWNHPIERKIAQGIDFHDAIITTILKNIEIGKDTTHVFCKSASDILDDLSDAFKREEAHTILHYLTHDLTETIKEANSPKIDLNLTPIIATGKIHYWFPGVLANKNYAPMLQNKLFLGDLTNKGQSNFDSQSWTNSAPLHISGVFQDSGYKHILVDKKYKKGSAYEKSDIDLAIYEDGYLFIFEIKYTYGRSEIKEIRKHTQEQGRSIQKAFNQLANHMAFLSQPTNLRDLFNQMKIKKKPEELKIIPIILDNTFEMDGVHEFKGHQIYKISDLELEVILKNEKAFLLDQNEIMKRGAEGLSKLSLRHGERCLPGDLLEHIRGKHVWEGVLDTGRLEVEQREVQVGDLRVGYWI
ncbi:MAG TPA: hypothetical protein PKB07_09970 [Flavilitoribacter sp.]|nr:hypothetical protein [Flavilitoribacter sp.]